MDRIAPGILISNVYKSAQKSMSVCPGKTEISEEKIKNKVL